MSDWGYQLYAVDDSPPEEVSFVLEIRFGDRVLEELRVSTSWSDTAIRAVLWLTRASFLATVEIVITGASTLQTGAEERTVGLLPDVTMTYLAVGESGASVRLVFLDETAARPRGVRTSYRKIDRLSKTDSSAECIDESWPDSSLYALCLEWYALFLFFRRGGLRVALHAARELKDVRDACRARRRLMDERESGASHA